MQTLKINFTDFYPAFKADDNFILDILKPRFSIELSEHPDYLIYSDYGHKHLKYDCIKIYYTGENLVPDFNLCDYASSGLFIDFEDRHLRLPLFGLIASYKKIANKQFDPAQALNRKFCCFVYSNQSNAHPIRNKFFQELSKYKTVDAGGRAFNNVGGPVRDKLGFLAGYKFTIAIENSGVNGYVSEKIVDPMSVNSIPVYWGSKYIGRDFNSESLVIIKDDSDTAIREAIEQIKFLDTHDEEYLNMLSTPWLKEEQKIDYEALYAGFLSHIFEQPYAHAWRRATRGFNMRRTEQLFAVFNAANNPPAEDTSMKDLCKLFCEKIIKKIKP